MPPNARADTAYGSEETLNWIVNEKNIASHIPVIDRSKREDGTEKPSDLPVLRAAVLEFVINWKAAKTLGITIPQSFKVRVDQVIE